jgi:hypothetical protein
MVLSILDVHDLSIDPMDLSRFTLTLPVFSKPKATTLVVSPRNYSTTVKKCDEACITQNDLFDGPIDFLS